MKHTALALICLIAAFIGGCVDPVHQELVDAIGPDPSGAPNGPLHRAGQPCLVCHDGSGPGNMVFSVAGTLYEYQGHTAPLVSGFVTLTAADGSTHQAESNCAGNFFIQQVDWDPVFPLHVELAYGNIDPTQQPQMDSHIGREGSCSACHNGQVGPSSVDRVYLALDMTTVIAGGGSCK